MCEQDRNLTVSDTFYPDWWNVNTHRCNHLNRTPLFQTNYGMGRAFFADWGRVGAVKARRDADEIKLIPQISNELAKKIHHCAVPVPLLSPFYASSVLPYTKLNHRATSSDPQSHESAKLPHNDADDALLAGNELTSENLLTDPIAGDHAAAALLCAKIFPRLRRNGTAFRADKSQSDSPTSSDTPDCLRELERLASEGYQCRTTTDQDSILGQISRILSSNSTKSSCRESDDDLDSNEEAFIGAMIPSPERRSKLPNRSRTTSVKRRKSLRKRALPQFLEELVQFDSKQSDQHFNHSRWLTGLDPFLIRLAGRPVNPVFQGNGLLCRVRQSVLTTPSTSDCSLLLWSPPKPPDYAYNCPNSLFFASCSPTLLHTERHVDHVVLPTKVLPGSARLCELDAIHTNAGSGTNILTRWTDVPSTNNIALFQLRTDDYKHSVPCALTHTFRPSLPARASSACFNPWLTDEWAVTGSHISQSGDRVAFLHLYSNECPEPTWSGHVMLDDPGETVSGMNRACCEASGLTDTIDTVQTSLTDAIEPTTQTNPRLSVFADGLRCSPFHHFLRVGFGSDPSQLCLTTSQRMVLIDTRQADVAQSLFRFHSGDPALDSLFHITDRFTSVAPRFMEDVFVLAGTTYNMLMLDKRMPTRPVLHWSHSLFGEPTYLDWTTPSDSLRTKYDLPQKFVTVCGQNPPNLFCVGLNLASFTGPQLVGPSCTGAPLTKVFTGAQNDLPTQLVTNKAVTQRLQSTYCGLASHINSSIESDSDYLGCVTLTGAGDLFMHSWHFDSTMLVSTLEGYSHRCRDWLSELRCNLVSETHAQTALDAGTKEFEVDLTEIKRLEEPKPPPTESDPECQYWSFAHLPPAKDFQSTSEIVCSSRHLVHDLWSLWDTDPTKPADSLETSTVGVSYLTRERVEEEQLRRAELDSCTEAAKNRIQRFKHILDRLTGDIATPSEIGDEEQYKDMNDEDYASMCF